MSGDPYCGNCHTWTIYTVSLHSAWPGWWRCKCWPAMSDFYTKDPFCKNSTHDHHDPLSPLVLSEKRIREVEEQGIQQKPFFEVIDELDEILEETNQKVCPWTCAFCGEHCAIACPLPEYDVLGGRMEQHRWECNPRFRMPGDRPWMQH